MRKISPSITGLAALAVCFLLALFPPPFLSALARIGEDVLIRSAARRTPSDRVMIVDIDEAGMQQYGQWPWPRRILADLTHRLLEYKAAVIAFDVVFPEIDRISPDAVLADWRRDYGPQVRIEGLPEDRRDDDRAFARALGEGICILGSSMEMGTPSTPPDLARLPPYRGRFVELGQPQRDALPQASGMICSIPLLKDAVASTAFFNTTVDEDNVVRRTPLLFAMGPDRIYPSLSLEAVRLKLGAEIVRIVYTPGGKLGVQDIRLLDRIIPTDGHGRLTLNYRGTPFPRYSATAILEGRASPNWFEGRIVLIGTSAAGMQDLRATPLRPETPGVDIHATAIDNLLAGDMLWTPAWIPAAQLTLLLLLNGCLIPFFRRVRAWVGLLLAMGAVLATVALAFVLLNGWRLLFAPADTALTTLAIYTLMTVVKYRNEELDRRRVRTMFGTMVSREVLEYLDAHPDRFALAGRKAEATVLFSDIHNFSTMAESMEPDRLSELLNRYLTPMADLVMARGGYVDKFNGDAMMAVWGAPYPTPEHATQACFSALEQHDRLADLREELAARFGQDVRIRIGINTGAVTAGNMGSERRFQYTVLGDPVNQAFRYEAVAKYYGIWTVIGEETWRQAQGNIEARRLDVVTVKGKTHPVTIYELLARKGRLDATRRAWIAKYEEALDHYRQRDFVRAAVLLEEALKDHPHDRPAALLLERTSRFLRNPPPADWAGILRLDFLGDPAGR